MNTAEPLNWEQLPEFGECSRNLNQLFFGIDAPCVHVGKQPVGSHKADPFGGLNLGQGHTPC